MGFIVFKVLKVIILKPIFSRFEPLFFIYLTGIAHSSAHNLSPPFLIKSYRITIFRKFRTNLITNQLTNIEPE